MPRARTPTPAATPDPTQVAIQKTLPVNSAELATLQAEAEATERDDLPLIVVDSQAAYQAADEVLTIALQRRDARVNQRGSVTQPLYGVIKTVEGWFRPEIQTLDRIIAVIKKRMGEYVQLCAEAEAEARRTAQLAAQTGDAETLVESLTLAQDAALAPTEGVEARVSFRWQVKRIAEDMLPAEYWTPDLDKIEAVAKAAGSAEEGSDAAPIIPGVIFERVANIAGSHGRRR